MSTETLIGFSGLKRRMLSVSDGNASASGGKAGWSTRVSVQEEAAHQELSTACRFHQITMKSGTTKVSNKILTVSGSGCLTDSRSLN